MRLTPRFTTLRRLAAHGLACAALAAATAAQAQVVVTTFSHLVDEPHYPVYTFSSSPFGFDAAAVPNSGVYSSARAIDNLRSRLPTGPVDDRVVFQDITNDSGLIGSSTVGQPIQASATLVTLPVPLLGPAVSKAMSAPYESHAYAGTALQHRFWNENPALVDGDSYPPNYFYLEHRRTARAESAWFETWTAQGAGRVDIGLGLDGLLGSSAPCGSTCLVSYPPGTDSAELDKPWVSMEAMFIVYDLSALAYCPDEELDTCGPSYIGHPTPMSYVNVKFSGDENLQISLDGSWTLSFDAIAGHRYLVMGTLSLEAQNGGMADFYNTMRVTGVSVAGGVLWADATGQDVATMFAPVPEPASLWLMLLGAVALFLTGRRLPR